MPHIGRFAAHVGPGDEQHPPMPIESGSVSNKGGIANLLHDGVAAGIDIEHGLFGEFGANQIQCLGAIGETGEYIEIAKRQRGLP